MVTRLGSRVTEVVANQVGKAPQSDVERMSNARRRRGHNLASDHVNRADIGRHSLRCRHRLALPVRQDRDQDSRRAGWHVHWHDKSLPLTDQLTSMPFIRWIAASVGQGIEHRPLKATILKLNLDVKVGRALSD